MADVAELARADEGLALAAMATDPGPAALSRARSVTALRVRERIEAQEAAALAPQAIRVTAARRDRVEEPSPTRTAFQVDRDRIVHSKSFRRTKHKTQVFLAPVGDHYRTRLTHILEVSQIGRSMANGLALNEDLVEAAALGHDVGHTPFGHVGEELLARFLPGGFRHNQQSVRIVERLERGGLGLNLTHEVRDAILKHSTHSTPRLAPRSSARTTSRRRSAPRSGRPARSASTR